MNRKEAIKWLKLLKTSPLIYGEYPEAIDMAIEALSADTVNRETYHNLVTASNDIDRALREYQDKEENGELVSVVRCKDCKNWRESHSEDEESYCYIDGRTTDSTDFCSWVERREP